MQLLCIVDADFLRNYGKAYKTNCVEDSWAHANHKTFSVRKTISLAVPLVFAFREARVSKKKFGTIFMLLLNVTKARIC